PERADREAPPFPQLVDRGERGGDAERAVEGAPVRHRVQVTAGHDRLGAARRARPGRRPGRVPPPPEIAVVVGEYTEVSFRRRLGEPGPAGGVLGRPGEPPVPAGKTVAADRQQRPPEGGEAHGTIMPPGPSPRPSAPAPRVRPPPRRPPRSRRPRAGSRPCPGRW